MSEEERKEFDSLKEVVGKLEERIKKLEKADFINKWKSSPSDTHNSR